MIKQTHVLTYPPDNDGELHIQSTTTETPCGVKHKFEFVRAELRSGLDARGALVATAREILQRWAPHLLK